MKKSGKSKKENHRHNAEAAAPLTVTHLQHAAVRVIIAPCRRRRILRRRAWVVVRKPLEKIENLSRLYFLSSLLLSSPLAA